MKNDSVIINEKDERVDIIFSRNTAPWLKEALRSAMDTIPSRVSDPSGDPMTDKKAKKPKPWNLSEYQEKWEKAECLEHLANAKPMPFIQIDGWKDTEPDLYFNPDKDRDSIMGGNSYELRHIGSDLAVRISIHADTKRKTAIRLLEKQLEWLKTMDKGCYNNLKPSSRFGRPNNGMSLDDDLPF